MSERISHSYLQADTLSDFPVKDRPKGQFFEGPIPGTILREIRLGEFAYGETATERVGTVLENYLPFAQDQLDLLAKYNIRTVNPYYMITQREVIEEVDTEGGDVQEVARRTEEVLSILKDKIDGAVSFDDALLSGNAEYIRAYDDLALRLVALFKGQYKASGKVETEFMHLEQYVIDPSAKTVRDMTVLVDVEPHEDFFEGDEAQSMIEYGIANLAQDILELTVVSNAQRLDSLPAVIDAIDSMSIIDYIRGDVKAPLLAALRSRDLQKVDALLEID